MHLPFVFVYLDATVALNTKSITSIHGQLQDWQATQYPLLLSSVRTFCTIEAVKAQGSSHVLRRNSTVFTFLARTGSQARPLAWGRGQ